LCVERVTNAKLKHRMRDYPWDCPRASQYFDGLVFLCTVHPESHPKNICNPW